MPDWFVILTPLVLIPIVLLLAFVGCGQVLGLGEFTDGTPVTFEYEGDLPKDVQSLDWRFNLEVTVDPEFGGPGVIGPSPGGEFTEWFKRTGAEIKAAGESDIVARSIDLRSYGSITCFCQVTTKNMPAQVIQTQQAKDKAEDFNAPTFKLVRAGASFAIN